VKEEKNNAFFPPCPFVRVLGDCSNEKNDASSPSRGGTLPSKKRKEKKKKKKKKKLRISASVRGKGENWLLTFWRVGRKKSKV
jgi:hypothetical protein